MAESGVIPPVKCRARSSETGQPCKRWAARGATVCAFHGGSAPQVKAAAARRVTLAEALARGDRRHPLEVLADSLHTVDTVSQQLLARIADGQPVTVEVVNAIMDAARSQAAMAKLVLEVGAGSDRWSPLEAVRRQAEALAMVVQGTVRRLGLDPASADVEAAFRAALRDVVGADVELPGRPKMIEGSVE